MYENVYVYVHEKECDYVLKKEGQRERECVCLCA